jgi:hypothetical protein
MALEALLDMKSVTRALWLYVNYIISMKTEINLSDKQTITII